MDIGLKMFALETLVCFIKNGRGKKNFSVVGGYYQGLTKGEEMFIFMLFPKKKLMPQKLI